MCLDENLLHTRRAKQINTRKRGKAQRVARQACSDATVHFLTYLQTGCATATWRITCPP